MTTTPLRPVFLSPATPTELVAYLLDNQFYPTTLVVAGPREQFVAAGAQTHDTDTPADEPSRARQVLDSTSLHHTVAAHHIRLIFAPTVSHLRAVLAAFQPNPALAPPAIDGPAAYTPSGPPLLLVFGLVAAHRHTSEWNAQGLAATAAALVDAAAGTAMRAVVVEPLVAGLGVAAQQRHAQNWAAVRDEMPVLGGRHGRAWDHWRVQVGTVLARWFQFCEGAWEG